MTATRPAEYDRQVINHLPLIRKIAYRLGVKDVEDFVQDVCVSLFRSSGESGTYRFATWVWTAARGVNALDKIRHATKKRSGRHVEFRDFHSPSVEANQEDYADLSAAVRSLSGTRDSDFLIRHAMGDSLAEIGRESGVGRERARQLVERERAHLRAAA